MATIIKRSPVVILKDLILLEIAAALVFFTAATVADYGEIYERLFFPNIISFNIAQTMFLFVGQAAIIVYVFFRWHREHVVITSDKVLYSRGLFWHREESVLREKILSVNSRQSPLDKLVGAGTITIRDTLGQTMIIPNISDPAYFTDALMGRRPAPLSGLADLALGGGDSLVELISRTEADDLEFKTTFRWDIRGNRVNKAVEKSVMKTIAAFMNSRGGVLVIGVDDSRSVIGLDYDYISLGKPNSDGFENHFSHVFQKMIGAQFRHLAHLNYETLDGKECCLVRVALSDKPVYLRADDTEEFYIRTGNGTTALKFSEAATYTASRFT